MISNSPIFILGTGRCGSTYLQRMISLNTRHWIWGEHDGFLRALEVAARQFEASLPLQRNVFSNEWAASGLREEMVSGTNDISWINNFKSDDLRVWMKRLISDVFGRDIPEDWDSWGFKEILYGLDNEVPALLLDLFPGSKIAFTFREPISTLNSMVNAWLPHLVDGLALSHEIELFAKRWLSILKYFLNLKTQQPSDVIFIPMSSLSRTAQILDALELKRCNRLGEYQAITNASKPHRLPHLNEVILKIVSENFGQELHRAYCDGLSVSV